MKFNMNKVANLGVRTLSQTVHPRENGSQRRKESKGKTESRAKEENAWVMFGHTGPQLQLGTQALQLHGTGITFHCNKPLLHLYDLPN